MLKKSANSIKVLAVAVVAALSVLGAGRALAGDQDFTVHNETGVTIKELYVSPHSTEDWEENVLGKDSLKDGEEQEITFPKREKAENWDLKVVDSDGNSVEWANLKLTEITDVTLTIKNGKTYATTKNGD
ncbi:hypothetical protein BH09VER1_BH09VER1_22020 [soil metagenome]